MGGKRGNMGKKGETCGETCGEKWENMRKVGKNEEMGEKKKAIKQYLHVKHKKGKYTNVLIKLCVI